MRSTVTFLAILAAIVFYPEALNFWMLIFSMIIWFLHYILDYNFTTQGRGRVLESTNSQSRKDTQANR